MTFDIRDQAGSTARTGGRCGVRRCAERSIHCGAFANGVEFRRAIELRTTSQIIPRRIRSVPDAAVIAS
ncbi:MAG TPA: hypothetical protein VKD69_02970 [Vicinamibacterales bacterium]|nr:hypothetical protein [Vicinamibacterales bacterium]